MNEMRFLETELHRGISIRRLISVIFVAAIFTWIAAPANLRAAPGDIIEQFGNDWARSTLGMAYDPVRNIMRYAHESQSSGHNPTIFDVSPVAPHAVLNSIAISTQNPGWPWQVDNRDGAAYDPDTGTYFLPDYNGDLSHLDDNIVEIDAAGNLVAYWETDDETGGSGCDCDPNTVILPDGVLYEDIQDTLINQIIDIAVDPDAPRHYYVTAAYDGNYIYRIDLSDTSGGSSEKSVCRVTEVVLPGELEDIMGDILGIAWDARNSGFWVTDWKSDNIAFLDRDFKLVTRMELNTPAGYSSGIAPVCGNEPPCEIWVTDFSSNVTTVVESPLPPATADMAVTKDDGLDRYIKGMTLTYAVTVSNMGPDSAENVVIADSAPPGTEITAWECEASGSVRCPNAAGSGDLAETVSIFPTDGELRYRIDLQTSLSSLDHLTNTATVSSDSTDPDQSNNSASDTNELPNSPLLSNSDGRDRYTPGTPTTYHVLLANPQVVPQISNIQFTDTITSGVAMSWTCQDLALGNSECPATSGAGPIDATISQLTLGNTLYFSITADIPSDFTGDLIHNAAVGSSAFTPMTATDTDVEYRIADLSITNSDGRDTYTPGETTTYQVAAANAGPSDASNAWVQDQAAAGTAITGWTCAAAGGAVCPNAGGSGNIDETAATLPVGGSLTYSVDLSIDSAFGGEGGLGGALTNTARISGDDHDPDKVNNSATDVNARTAYRVSTAAGAGGALSPTERMVEHGLTADFAIIPDAGFHILGVSGCSGSLAEDRYTAGPVAAPCTITAEFGRSGDIDGDDDVDLADAIAGLKILADIPPATVNLDADVNQDGRIGLEDVIFVLQKVGELR